MALLALEAFLVSGPEEFSQIASGVAQDLVAWEPPELSASLLPPETHAPLFADFQTRRSGVRFDQSSASEPAAPAATPKPGLAVS